MPSPITLSTSPPKHPALDFERLRDEGIRHLERLAGQLWTDFNAHDPGITILEQVCYALTDLAHRIEYGMPDLLAGAEVDSLYTPAQILTSAPVTMTDIRKLVVDVAGVKNAWVEKVEEQTPPLYYNRNENALTLQGDRLTSDSIYLKGLYRVLVELSDLLYVDTAGEQRPAVLREVIQRLHAHRGLCEDYESIAVLEPEYIKISASIEIEAVENAEQVLLQIYQCIGNYVSPPVPIYSLTEMLDAGKRVDEIFDGPRLEHGFIDTEALAQWQRRAAIRTSDMINAIMDVPGVRAVRTIQIPIGDTWENWSMDLDTSRTPKLDIDGSDVRLERNQLEIDVDNDSVVRMYYQAIRDAGQAGSALEDLDIAPQKGRDRSLGNYYSVQHHFPANYGIGSLGLPKSASALRKSQAKQLKAYLLFYDQLLANYFSQLAHVKDLFSFSGANGSGDPARTYFSQVIDDPALGLAGIFKSEAVEFKETLQQITENPADPDGSVGNYDRRNRFLNHLLARFAEQFTDYSLLLFGAMPKEGVAPTEKLAHDKQDFLREYPLLSSRRGAAFNVLHPQGEDNISGLEQRLRRLLGLNHDDSEARFYMVEHLLLRPISDDLEQNVPILTAPQNKDPYSLQLSFVFPKWPKRFQHPGFKAFVERTVREETPAHLLLTIHWLDQTAMDAFEGAYANWLEKRRKYTLAQPGV